MTKRDWLFGEPRETVCNIVKDVARRAGVSVGDIYGRATARRFSRPRQAAMYLAVTRTGKSYQQVGRIFGRDHTTVLHAIRAVEARPHLYPIGTPNE